MVIDDEQPRVHDSTVRRVRAVGYRATPVIGQCDSLADARGHGMRVVVADDAVLFREGLARLLAVAEFEVSAQVGNAQALLERVREDPPDVAVIDIRMPPAPCARAIRPWASWCRRRMWRPTSRCSSSRTAPGAPDTCSRHAWPTSAS